VYGVGCDTFPYFGSGVQHLFSSAVLDLGGVFHWTVCPSALHTRFICSRNNAASPIRLLLLG
jgi:hypothetical protein